MFLNIPIALTWLRIILIPVFVAVYYLPDAWLSPVAKNWTAMSFFAVAFIGKVKTAAQMTAIIALLLYEPLIPGVSTPLLGTIALWVAAILTLWSMFHYLRLAAPHIAEPSPRIPEARPRNPSPRADPGASTR